MRPLRLVMRAFGPYAGEEHIDFTALGSRACFLIHGATGSGKTSILDAICFALYGDSSGGEREPRRLRSDFADPATRTEVVFDFSLGDQRYRVCRSPEQERPKVRGEGTTTQTATATVWRRTGVHDEAHDGEVLATQPRQVTGEVEKLLGFRSDQFRQVVLLPQGRFRELLTADSKKREEILEVLFQTELYRRIEDALKERARTAKAALEQAEQEQTFVLTEAGAESEEALARQRQEQVEVDERLRICLERMRADRASAEADLQKAREQAAQVTERRSAVAGLQQLEQEGPGIAQKAARVDAGRRAEKLADVEALVASRDGERAKAEGACSTAARELDTAGRDALQAEATLEQERQREPEREKLRASITRLEDLKDVALQLASARDQEATLAARVKRQRGAARRAQAEHARVEGEVEKARSDHEAARALARQRDTRRKAVQAAKRSVAQSAKATAAKRDLATARQQLKEASAERGVCKRALERARRSLKKIEAEWVAGQAGLLARELKSGVPCPVCGSPEHPAPAHARRRVPDREQLEAARVGVEERQDAVDHAAEKSSKCQSRVQALTAMIHGLRGEGRSQESEPAFRRALEKVEEDFKESERAAVRAEQLSQRVAALRRHLASCVKELKAANATLRGAEREASRQSGVVRERERKVPQELRVDGAVEAKLSAQRRKLADMTTVLDKARRLHQAAVEMRVKTKQALTAAQEVSREATAKADEARTGFLARLSLTGFENEENYRAAKLDAAAIAKLAAEVEQHQRDLAAAQERVRRAREASEGLDLPDLAPLEVRVQEVQHAIEQKSNEHGQLVERLARMSQWLQQLKALAGRRAAAERDFRCVAYVSETVNGQNLLGMTLQRYVLGALLDEVLVAASHRLRVMTRGRFDLERDRTREDARRAGGLDLVVLDAYTGTSRPVNTLSGGEEFMASLSLALGLADVVQSHAGGIRLDTIFVDEGFAYLDEEAIDLALQTLLQLHEGGRLVGIVSHVGELRERIDARLQVTTTPQGSTARFVM